MVIEPSTEIVKFITPGFRYQGGVRLVIYIMQFQVPGWGTCIDMRLIPIKFWT